MRDADADRRYLVAALLLLSGFMVREVIVAVISGSLALLSGDRRGRQPTSAHRDCPLARSADDP